MIGGTELPPVKRSFAAFELGARSVNPRARVIVSYIGNWDDVSAGKEQAIAQIARGADVIFQNADAAGLGVFQAVKESKGTRIIGSNSNQNDIVPESTLGSVVIDLPHAFLIVARAVADTAFQGKVFSLGLNDDVVTFVANPAMERAIPERAKAAVDSVRRQMMSGSFAGRLLPDSMSR
jgi:basic membrane lipoprotein Med (substrate-binding protein (PBP1-ABC) superfamily)